MNYNVICKKFSISFYNVKEVREGRKFTDFYDSENNLLGSVKIDKILYFHSFEPVTIAKGDE